MSVNFTRRHLRDCWVCSLSVYVFSVLYVNSVVICNFHELRNYLLNWQTLLQSIGSVFVIQNIRHKMAVIRLVHHKHTSLFKTSSTFWVFMIVCETYLRAAASCPGCQTLTFKGGGNSCWSSSPAGLAEMTDGGHCQEALVSSCSTLSI